MEELRMDIHSQIFWILSMSLRSSTIVQKVVSLIQYCFKVPFGEENFPTSSRTEKDANTFWSAQ